MEAGRKPVYRLHSEQEVREWIPYGQKSSKKCNMRGHEEIKHTEGNCIALMSSNLGSIFTPATVALVSSKQSQSASIGFT